MRSTFNVFFFNDTATTEIYTLSLHDALPICRKIAAGAARIDGGTGSAQCRRRPWVHQSAAGGDRKSTRLNSSHQIISYAVFCLQKKNRYVRSTANSTLPVHRLTWRRCGGL